MHEQVYYTMRGDVIQGMNVDFLDLLVRGCGDCDEVFHDLYKSTVEHAEAYNDTKKCKQGFFSVSINAEVGYYQVTITYEDIDREDFIVFTDYGFHCYTDEDINIETYENAYRKAVYEALLSRFGKKVAVTYARMGVIKNYWEEALCD